jgi:hypothetical protein
MAAWNYKDHIINALLWAAAGDMAMNNLRGSLGNPRLVLGVSAAIFSWGTDFVSPMVPM